MSSLMTRFLLFVLVELLEVEKVPVACRGITLIDNDIVLGNTGVIYIINREGERLNTIKVGKGSMYSLYCGKDKTLYCCDTDNDQ
jgi:hypothetical protein